jgi:hypothetical protein
MNNHPIPRLRRLHEEINVLENKSKRKTGRKKHQKTQKGGREEEKKQKRNC